MDRVAEHAQVSKRKLYNQFPSIEKLFGAIAEMAKKLENMTQLKTGPPQRQRRRQ
ncbi:TetR family transcriptional regulator [Halioglobus maricola]|uniref:TetR family transcriptional regulator n=1 Tax=Halioglobus maricola TaxID=2601894 RepID=A0A5P9NPJ2_9GAMM|nr:TetR family transcriptional regulator [Halioglobus maricola]